MIGTKSLIDLSGPCYDLIIFFRFAVLVDDRRGKYEIVRIKELLVECLVDLCDPLQGKIRIRIFSENCGYDLSGISVSERGEQSRVFTQKMLGIFQFVGRDRLFLSDKSSCTGGSFHA